MVIGTLNAHLINARGYVDVTFYITGKIIAAEPYLPSGSEDSKSLSDRINALGGTLPGADPRQSKVANAGSYSPAEQLQREKSGVSTGEVSPTFLHDFSAVVHFT